MRLLAGLLGLLLGIVAGACLVLANPLAWLQGGLPPLSAEIAPVKAYRWEDFRGIEAGAPGLLGLDRPAGGVTLRDPALRHVRVGILVLPAGEGTPAALAVRMSAVAEENSLVRAQLGTHDYWNIFWPGEGSVFASGYSNFWGLIRHSIFASDGDVDPESPLAAFPVSAASPPGFSTGVIGAAGRYARFTGEVRELVFPPQLGAAGHYRDWELALKVNPPPVPAR